LHPPRLSTLLRFPTRSPLPLEQDVQRTRVAAVQALEAFTGDNAAALKQLLKEVVIILFHSIVPPDRVGVVRRL
jgi:hypothetical protein